MAKRVQRPRPKIELDELLTGTPSWEDVVEFFRIGEFHDERYTVAAIEKHLLTEEQRKKMFDLRFDIVKMLNGYVEGEEPQKVKYDIFAEWNAKLGFHHFGC